MRSLFNPQSAFRNLQLFGYFSLGQQVFLFLLALLILGLVFFRFFHHPSPALPEKIAEKFVIEVTGEVKNPGVHFFQEPPTLQEAIEMAGGLEEKAHLDSSSSSERLETGTVISVGKETEKEIRMKLGRMEAHKLLVFSVPLDLNRVSVEDLCLIPGIGESLAREIVAHRERRGFRSVQELKNVKGIGEKKWKELKPYFAVAFSGLKP